MHGCDDARHARKLFSKFKYYNMFVFHILYNIIIGTCFFQPLAQFRCSPRPGLFSPARQAWLAVDGSVPILKMGTVETSNHDKEPHQDSGSVVCMLRRSMTSVRL